VQTGYTKLAKAQLIAQVLPLVQTVLTEPAAVVVAEMHVIQPLTAPVLQTLYLNEQQVEAVVLV
jgi:hypothetical protein